MRTSGDNAVDKPVTTTAAGVALAFGTFDRSRDCKWHDGGVRRGFRSRGRETVRDRKLAST